MQSRMPVPQRQSFLELNRPRDEASDPDIVLLGHVHPMVMVPERHLSVRESCLLRLMSAVDESAVALVVAEGAHYLRLDRENWTE